MKNKILIGSIIAVTILILMSFTGVVGHQTTSSTIAKASPLFTVRSNRAIGEESKVIDCNYVSKGNKLSFPNLNDRTISINKIVDSEEKG